MSPGTDIVTGAFGYIGRYITAQLLDSGRAVKTITTHIDKPNPFGARVKAYQYNFDHPELLKETLQGAEILYNTYWVRFNYGTSTFSQAVRNTARDRRRRAQPGKHPVAQSCRKTAVILFSLCGGRCRRLSRLVQSVAPGYRGRRGAIAGAGMAGAVLVEAIG